MTVHPSPTDWTLRPKGKDYQSAVSCPRCPEEPRETTRAHRAGGNKMANESKIRPLHDRILVEREEEERKSAGGIVIPDSATEKPIQGKTRAAPRNRTSRSPRR